MKRLFINAIIWGRTDTAILTEGEKIYRIGMTEELQKEAESVDEVINLNGLFVCPGFIDSHLHLLEYGRYLENVQLHNCTSKQEVLDLLKKQEKKLQEGEWLLGRGFNEGLFEDPQMPTKEDLDQISKERPIAVTRCCGHKMVVNSKALELANMDEDSMVEGGSIDFENGFLEETAITVLHDSWPAETEESIRKSILRGQQELNRYGITAVGSDDFMSITHDWRLVLDVMMKMAYRGELTVRVNEQCEFPSPEEFAAFLDEGYTTDIGDDLFRIGPLKIIAYGSLGARTAALSKDYSDEQGNSGYMVYSRSELETWVKLASDYNMPVITHAIGDRTVREVLNVYDKYVIAGNLLHYGLVHCQIMTPAEIKRTIDLNLCCYFQSLFIDPDAKILEARVGNKRAESCYPFRTLSEHVIACNGSDAPVETPDVMKGLQMAVTRRSLDGTAAMNPSECMDLSQAMRSYTLSGAEAFFASDRIGSLEEGKYADFAVLDRDITKLSAEEIHTAKVMMTVMNGETVFEK